jgi:hypothetical protein
MFLIFGDKIVALDEIAVPPTRFDPFWSRNQSEWAVPERSGIAFGQRYGGVE